MSKILDDKDEYQKMATVVNPHDGGQVVNKKITQLIQNYNKKTKNGLFYILTKLNFLIT